MTETHATSSEPVLVGIEVAKSRRQGQPASWTPARTCRSCLRCDSLA